MSVSVCMNLYVCECKYVDVYVCVRICVSLCT